MDFNFKIELIKPSWPKIKKIIIQALYQSFFKLIIEIKSQTTLHQWLSLLEEDLQPSTRLYGGSN
jgi:16S rRNA U1498 N3-methylase RsmE